MLDFGRHDDVYVECPFCGDQIGDVWDWWPHSNEETTEIDCEECGERYVVAREYSITYSTAKPALDKPPEEE